MRIASSVDLDSSAELATIVANLRAEVAELQRAGRSLQSPWGTPAGGRVKITTAHNAITTVTDVTGLTITWTATARRLYRIAASVLALQNTSAGIVDVRITDSANNVVAQSSFTQGISAYATHTPWTTLTGLSGPVTYKVRMATTGGTVNAQMGAPTPGLLVVEDIGPE